MLTRNLLTGYPILYHGAHSKRFLQHKAVVLESIGGCFVDKLVDTRKPMDMQVLVKVDACGVSYRDTLDREGAFPFIQLPAILGHEVSGTVIDVGNNVSELKPGDKVVSVHWAQDDAWPSPLTRSGPVKSFLGLTLGGGYQEKMIVPQSTLIKIDDSIAKKWTPQQAAVWMGAKARAGLKPNSTVLITGASGGVGSAAIQLCKHFNCRVICVTSSQAKAEYIQSIGADDVVVFDKHFHKNKALENGVDMVIECTGEPTFEYAIRTLRPEGSLVLVGNTTNAIAKLPIGLTILNSLKIIGSDSISRTALSELFEFMTNQNLRPVVESSISLTADSLNSAHEKLQLKGAKGRIVVDVSSNSWA